ncbi:41827_t:CDS:2, partial [Gigaspora margarita]
LSLPSFVNVAVIYSIGAFALFLADAVVMLVGGRQLRHRFWCGYVNWLVADFWT